VTRTVVVSRVCVRDVCECALISVPKSTTSSASSDDFSMTFGDVKVTCLDWVRTVAVVVSDGHWDGYSVTNTTYIQPSKVKQSRSIAGRETLPHCSGKSHDIWDHTVLPGSYDFPALP